MKRTKEGFTLIELLIVIAIIALLSWLSVLSLFRVRQKAKLTRVEADLSTIAKAVNQYADDNNYQYPPDAARSVPPGLEKYLQGGTWPTSAWGTGVFDWDNLVYTDHQYTLANTPAKYQPNVGLTYQSIAYRLCNSSDPDSACSDPVLFPNFTRDSAIFYCVNGPCIPHQDEPDIYGYCTNCKIKPYQP